MRARDSLDRASDAPDASCPPAVRVSLLATSPVVRAGLETLLSRRDAVTLVADVASAEVVVADLSTARGAPRVPDLQAPLVALAQPDDLPHLRAAGVHGVSFSAGPGDLLAAIAAAHVAGRAPTPTTTAGAGSAPDGRPAAPLSARERLVVDGICRGMSNLDLAASMYVSINSVKTYIRSAYRKIGVERRSQAILWGLAHGFGADDDTV